MTGLTDHGRGYAPPCSDDLPEQQRRISFVIPVRNDAERLERCLRGIRANHYAADLVDVIVADNGSTDASASVARKYGAMVLSLPNLRLGALRNAGAAAVRGHVIAFVDADHEIGPLWAATAVTLLAEKQVTGVGAAYSPPEAATWVQQFYDLLRSHTRGTQAVDWLGSGNLAVRREAFVAVGGFDTTLETCEDVDLCRKLRASGLLISDDRLRSVHYGDPQTLRDVFFGELWRGRDNVRVSLRKPRSWRMLVSAALPVVNLLALAGIAVGLMPFLTNGRLVAALGGVLILTQLALRSAVMLRHRGVISLSAIPRALAVGTAYELGRSLAVLGRFGYSHRRDTATPS